MSERITTVHDRFQVCVRDTELLESFQTFYEAMRYCRRYEGEELVIYDLMAHRGRPDLWDREGKVLEVKE